MSHLAAAEYEIIAFNYDALDGATAQNTRAAAERVRARLSATKKAILEIGGDLLAVKDGLPRGQFTAWLLAEFDMTDRTARNYMRAAEVFSGKTETVSVLAPTAIYALAAPSMPEDVRSVVIGRLDAGERVSEVEIRDLAREARAAAKEAERQAKRTPRQRRSAEQRARELEERSQKWQREAAEKKHKAKAIVEMLAEAFGEQFNAFAAMLESADLWTVRDSVRAVVGRQQEAA